MVFTGEARSLDYGSYDVHAYFVRFQVHSKSNIFSIFHHHFDGPWGLGVRV